MLAMKMMIRRGMLKRSLVWLCSTVAMGWGLTALASENKVGILDGRAFELAVERFNQQDEELYGNTIRNEQAWAFLKEEVPYFECPDKEIEEIYHFRWWTFRKHLKDTVDGWVVTEFLPPVGWASKHNTINCPAGHHFYEGRWIRNPEYLRAYAEFYFRTPGARPRHYSFWAADSIHAFYQVASE